MGRRGAAVNAVPPLPRAREVCDRTLLLMNGFDARQPPLNKSREALSIL